LRGDLWQQRLRRWLAARRQGRASARSDSAPTDRRDPFVRCPNPLGIEELFAFASGLAAERHLAAPGPHWRLRWAAEGLPGGEHVGRSLSEAVDRFSGEGVHDDFSPLGAARAEDLLFFDTETLGLGNAGVFLIGWLALSQGRVVVEQALAQDYSEEAAILAAFARAAAGRSVLVSFNGKAFDMPLLSCRAGMWQVDLGRAERMPHVDLLYECRRRWSGSLPDCRLQTVEAALSGRARTDDVPGWQIPSVYDDFVISGDARPLGPILKHNMLDLLAMVRILIDCIR